VADLHPGRSFALYVLPREYVTPPPTASPDGRTPDLQAEAVVIVPQSAFEQAAYLEFGVLEVRIGEAHLLADLKERVSLLLQSGAEHVLNKTLERSNSTQDHGWTQRPGWDVRSAGMHQVERGGHPKRLSEAINGGLQVRWWSGDEGHEPYSSFSYPSSADHLKLSAEDR
jgi:hypothetical protein